MSKGVYDLNWDDIRVLLALVRSGSLTRASQMLGVDQSTVGRRLSSLEGALGTTLFLRSKTGILPTEIGEKLISDALEIEKRADSIMQTAASPASEPVGEVRIMGDHWVLQKLANSFVPTLIELFPKLSIRLSSGTPSAGSWSAATISLWFEEPPQMGEFAIKLIDVPFALYTKRGISGHANAWVSMMDDFATRRTPAKLLEKLRDRDDPVHVIANDPGLLHASIRSGMGKGLLPVCMAQDDPALRRLGGPGIEIMRVLHIHAHPDTVQSIRVQTIIRQLRENASRLFSGAKEEGQPTRPDTQKKPATAKPAQSRV